MSASDVQDIVTVYGVQSRPFVPDPTSAAIQLVFALEEAGISLQIPPHLPETRTIANATFRTGPTKEDFHALASYRTPLHSDTLLPRDTERRCVASHHESTGRSARHDVQFRDVLHSLRHSRESATREPVPSSSVPFQYICGSMTGRWEGTYKASLTWTPRILQLTMASLLELRECSWFIDRGREQALRVHSRGVHSPSMRRSGDI